MGINELISGVGEWVGLPTAFIGLLVGTLIFVLIAWRAWSLHPFLLQLWRLLLGRLTVHDPDVNRLIQQRDDLVKFRFVFGIRARTLLQAQRIREWSTKHNEDLADIRACARYFDIEECELAKTPALPSVRTRSITALCAALLLPPLLLAIACFAVDRALVQLKISGVYLTLSTD